jgi:hypothetical protein
METVGGSLLRRCGAALESGRLMGNFQLAIQENMTCRILANLGWEEELAIGDFIRYGTFFCFIT